MRNGPEALVEIVRSVQAVVDMYFLEHAYGTPAEANALAHQVVNHLGNQGYL